ncbi:hypothetical protein MNBD_ALPHA06-2004 [hydrothermal vent metagenome]|uniref:PpiC domain-containing protein n=1 Tax=hydrothermal vent metagenome TaxID=652676 RepID=A0A3B0S3K2_9ZZZZ
MTGIRRKIYKTSNFLLVSTCLLVLIAACGPKPVNTPENGFGSRVPDVGDKTVAEVNGTLITQMDVEREAVRQNVIASGDLLAGNPDAYARILDELIDQRLLALEAVRRGLEQDREAKIRLGIARERILGNILVERSVADAVTETAIQRLYGEQSKLAEPGEEVRARHILVDTQEAAVHIRKLLGEGASFAELAFEHSTDAATRLEGGDLGYFTQDVMLAPFAEAAFALSLGELSEPVQTKYGWHIIKLEGRRPVKMPDLEELRPRIVRFMTFDEIQKLVSELTTKADIVRVAPPENTSEPAVINLDDTDPAKTD